MPTQCASGSAHVYCQFRHSMRMREHQSHSSDFTFFKPLINRSQSQPRVSSQFPVLPRSLNLAWFLILTDREFASRSCTLIGYPRDSVLRTAHMTAATNMIAMELAVAFHIVRYVAYQHHSGQQQNSLQSLPSTSLLLVKHFQLLNSRSSCLLPLFHASCRYQSHPRGVNFCKDQSLPDLAP